MDKEIFCHVEFAQAGASEAYEHNMPSRDAVPTDAEYFKRAISMYVGNGTCGVRRADLAAEPVEVQRSDVGNGVTCVRWDWDRADGRPGLQFDFSFFED